MGFVHLHVHSQFSLLDGALTIEALAPAVKAIGQTGVALTDHTNLYGAVTFHKACKEQGLHPVFGAGLWVQPEGVGFKDPANELGGYHLIALIEDKTGYKNLNQLITRAIFDGIYYKPRIDLELLRQHHEGLIFLTSGMRGPVRAPWARGEPDLARRRLTELAEILGPEHLYLELQDVGLPGDDLANDGCRALGQEFGLKTVVTNNVHYLKPEDAPVLDLLQCIGQGVALHDERRRRPCTDQLYLKTEAELRALFPEDGEAIDRTEEISERCHFKFDYGVYYFPASTPPDTQEGADTQANWSYFYNAFPPPRDLALPVPAGADAPDKPEGAEGSLNGYFAWYSRQGLRHRLRRIPEDRHPEYWDRLELELAMIAKMGFAAYFLIVAEFINWAKDHEIPVGPGRGSAAGSLVAYAQRITDIDPIRFELLFERFLNPERVSMPDVDVDFCQDRREEVIEHTRQKYGREFVSQIITYGKLQAKLAVRDVARVCDLNFNDADRIAKLIPNELGITLEAAKKEEALLRLYEGDGRVRRILDLASSIEGMTRQTGVHAAGVVVADRPLVQLAPLYRDGPEGGPVVQFDMKSAESIGLIKFDFLGLKTLDQIRDAVKLIARNEGATSIDMSDIDIEDAKTYKLLIDGDALGVFQVESSGMRELLRKLKPSCLDDLVALVALYRPGPLNAGMVDDFIDRKHGRKRVEYPVPALEPILRSTYGVVVYQEQVMQIAQVLSSYSLGEADLLRRAMGKKKPEEMAKQKERFVSGAVKNGYDKDKADGIFELLAMFAAYGFNKSHSAAYGYVSYQTAWLKANHRAEFMAALMSIESANTDKILIYLTDCKRAGITILPPDVNESLRPFDVPKMARNTIRYGLGAIKGIGDAAVDAILDARVEAGGRFRDLMDCLDRLDLKRVNKKVLENLIKAGAFDWTGHARAALFAGLDAAVSAAQKEQADKASGQVGLFGMLGGGGPPAPRFRPPDEQEWSLGKRLGFERDAVGFYLSGHPVEAFAENLGRYVTCRLGDLSDEREGAEVTVPGMATASRQVRTKRGDKMGFVTLDDGTGTVECVFFSDAWERSARAFKDDGVAVLVKGELEKTADGCKILAESAEPLAELIESRAREVHICVDHQDLTAARVTELRGLMERCAGSTPTMLIVERAAHSRVTMRLPPRLCVLPDERFRDGVASIFRRNDAVRLK
ncbi:MAG: DNA polymerase III subunit alpha [Deltaproteobacteria bacterium]|nr:DNA polymerase III subunit alpha [Deltaproteobacteria bacterium]